MLALGPWFVLALAQQLHAPPPSSDPLADPEIWSFGGIGGPQPIHTTPPPPPIVPRDWVFRALDPDTKPSTALSRWILDPGSAPPKTESDSNWSSKAPDDPKRAVAAFTVVRSEVDEVRMARLTGIEWMLWNGELFQGDPERRKFGGVPVLVHAGENQLFVAARNASFECELWKPPARLVIEPFDVRWPDSSWFDDVSYPVFNASAEPTSFLHVHYGHAAPWTATSKPHLTDWHDHALVIPPLCLVTQAHFLWGSDDWETQDAKDVHYVPVAIWDVADVRAERRLFRRPADPTGITTNNVSSLAHPPNDPLHRSTGLAQNCGAQVYATGGGASARELSLSIARFGQQQEWYWGGAIPLLLSDLEWPIGTSPWKDRLACSGVGAWVALHGNADTNDAWSRLVPPDAPFEAHEGRVIIEGTTFTGPDLAGWYCFERGRTKLLVLFDTGESGARLSACLQTSMRVGDEVSAVFRVDASAPEGWVRLKTSRER